MRKIQMKILMVVASVVVFTSVALADGDMGGGGLWGNEPSPSKVTVRTDENVVADASAAFNGDEYGIDWLLNSINDLLGLSE